MSTGFYTRSYYRMMRGELAMHSATLKWMLLRNTGAYTFNPDHDFVADLFSNGGVECTVASYLRQVAAGKTMTLDDATNRSIYTQDPVDFGALEAGQTVSAFVMYQHVTNDADSPLIFHCDGLIRIGAAAPAAIPETGVITAATQANPVVITSAAHGLVNGEKVKITSVVGMTQINNIVFTVAGVTTNTFQLSGINGTGYTAYTSGGVWKKVRKVYIISSRDAIIDGAAVDFGGGATGVINGNYAAGSTLIEIIDLAAAIDAGDASDVQSQVLLPAALGGGNFTINFNAGGFFYILGGT